MVLNGSVRGHEEVVAPSSLLPLQSFVASVRFPDRIGSDRHEVSRMMSEMRTRARANRSRAGFRSLLCCAAQDAQRKLRALPARWVAPGAATWTHLGGVERYGVEAAERHGWPLSRFNCVAQ